MDGNLGGIYRKPEGFRLVSLIQVTGRVVLDFGSSLVTIALGKEVSMPQWLTSTIDVFQLVVNVGALVGGAIIWKLYVANLKAARDSKDAEISNVEKNRDMWKDQAQEWKDKVQELQKRSPEFIERTLSERIQIRESEIFRFAEDKDRNEEDLKVLQREKSDLENDLLRSQGFRLMLALEEGAEETEEGEDAEPTELFQSQPGEIQVVLLGEVGVDSGQLMVTDPLYIDAEWQHDINNDDAAKTAADDPPSHVESDVAVTGEHPLWPYSYEGVMATTLSAGYGELAYKMGHAGAGVVFSTGWGDGVYPVYGELHEGRILRVFITTG